MVKEFLLGFTLVIAVLCTFFPATLRSEESDEVMTITVDSTLLNKKTDDVLYITPSGEITEDTETYSGYCVILESFNGATPVDIRHNTAKVNINFTHNQLRMPEFYLPDLNVKFKMRSKFVVPGPRHVIIRHHHRGPRIHRIPPPLIHRPRPVRINRPPKRPLPPKRPVPPKRSRPPKPRRR